MIQSGFRMSLIFTIINSLFKISFICPVHTGSRGTGAGEGPSTTASAEPVTSPRWSEVWLPPVRPDTHPWAPELPVPSGQYSRPQYHQLHTPTTSHWPGPSIRHSVSKRRRQRPSEWRNRTGHNIKRFGTARFSSVKAWNGFLIKLCCSSWLLTFSLSLRQIQFLKTKVQRHPL